MKDKNELDKIKREISYHTMCKPCRNCGECERILEMALKEAEEKRGAAPCESCRL